MKKITLSAALKSGMGRIRTNNEDAYYFNGKFAEMKEMDQETSLECAGLEDTALFAICDGMGGCENGEVAAYTAVSGMPRLQSALKTTDFSSATTKWVEETGEAISQAARDGGCTLALLYIQSGEIHIAHIGNSRIYKFSHGKLLRMTKDHSKLQVLLDAGLLSEKDAGSYPQRHVITRALGMNEEENGKCMATIHEPVPAENQDRYLICSDGVTDMLSDNRIESLLASSQNVRESADAVYQAALEAGGKDNTTVIVIDIQCRAQEENDPKDPLDSTWTPAQESPESVSIEQLTTIKQGNGRIFTIKTRISGSQLSGIFPLT